MSRRIIYDQRERCLTWAAKRIGHDDFGDYAHAMGLLNGDGRLIAVTVWDNFSNWNCFMSVASDGSRRWMTPAFLYRSFFYPFEQLGLRRVTLTVASDNAASENLARRLGFSVECAAMPALFGDKDGIVLGLLREDCRWLTPQYRRHAVRELVDG
jgi:RimJ/RimL family protein N-acetyltransferase